MRKFTILLAVLTFCFTSAADAQQKVKTKTSIRVPKISIAFFGGFSYMLGSANGNAANFDATYKEVGNIYTGTNLGMQQGYGGMVVGKFAINKKKKWLVTANLGYNFFYNTYDTKMRRTLWNLFNLGGGMEYHFNPKQRERLFVGAELNYNLLFGGWQSYHTYPDNSVSNIYTRFNPASRLGMALTTGMEFRLSRKTDLVVALRGVWSNIVPKQNFESNEPFYTYINDSGNNNGIELDGKKNIIFMQVVVGISLPISYK